MPYLGTVYSGKILSKHAFPDRPTSTELTQLPPVQAQHRLSSFRTDSNLPGYLHTGVQSWDKWMTAVLATTQHLDLHF